MRSGNNKTLSPRSHSEVFFHNESCTPSVCTPMRAAIRKLEGRTHLGEGASFPNVLSSLLPSLTCGVCTNVGLGTSLRCSAG